MRHHLVYIQDSIIGANQNEIKIGLLMILIHSVVSPPDVASYDNENQQLSLKLKRLTFLLFSEISSEDHGVT